MSDCLECLKEKFTYRIVNTISDRNTMPCDERQIGMLVTVIGEDLSYKQYMLKGGDPCVNTNWEDYSFTSDMLKDLLGHATISEELPGPITSAYLNTRFPNSLEGFKVTSIPLNTTFMRIFDDTWLMSNNLPI